MHIHTLSNGANDLISYGDMIIMHIHTLSNGANGLISYGDMIIIHTHTPRCAPERTYSPPIAAVTLAPNSTHNTHTMHTHARADTHSYQTNHDKRAATVAIRNRHILCI